MLTAPAESRKFTNLLEPVLRSSTLHEYRIIAAASHAPAEGNAHHRNTHMTPWGK